MGVGDRPAAVGLQLVVSHAQRPDVRGIGLAAVVPRDGVVLLAVRGLASAAGEPADPVPGGDEVPQPVGDGVGAAAVVEQVPGERVGDQPPHRDGDVGIGEQPADDVGAHGPDAGDLRDPATGARIVSGVSGVGEGAWTPRKVSRSMVMSTCARSPASGIPDALVPCGEEEGGGGLGPALPDGGVAVGDEPRVVGEGADPCEAGVGGLGGQPDREQGVAVVAGDHERVTGLAGGGAAAGLPVGVDDQDGPLRARPRLREGAARGDRDDPVLQPGAQPGELGPLRHIRGSGGGRVGADGGEAAGQAPGRVGDHPRVGRGDLPGGQRVQGGRQGPGQQPGGHEALVGGLGALPQRGGDLLPGGVLDPHRPLPEPVRPRIQHQELLHLRMTGTRRRRTPRPRRRPATR